MDMRYWLAQAEAALAPGAGHAQSGSRTSRNP
jgi:hypothetical protein